MANKYQNSLFKFNDINQKNKFLHFKEKISLKNWRKKTFKIYPNQRLLEQIALKADPGIFLSLEESGPFVGRQEMILPKFLKIPLEIKKILL